MKSKSFENLHSTVLYLQPTNPNKMDKMAKAMYTMTVTTHGMANTKQKATITMHDASMARCIRNKFWVRGT